MRITIVNRYFWPETVLVNDIAAWLAEDGHDVWVLTGQPDYNPEAGLGRYPFREERNGVKIRRINPLRLNSRGVLRNLNSLLFVFLAGIAILFGRRSDAVWCTSIPPVVQPLWLRWTTWLRGQKFIYFPQDIYPEIATSMGLMREGWFSRLLMRVDTHILDKADAVITISSDMVDHIRGVRGANPSHLEVIRSFSPVDQPRPERKSRPSTPLRFVFAGNIGRFQNLRALVDAFGRLDPALAQLELLGDGREKHRLQKLVTDRSITNVHFHNSVSAEEAFTFVSQCDIGVVSLAPDIYRYAFPAKTYTYIGAGLPLLAMIEHESELAALVRERQMGEVVSWADDHRELVHAIERLVENYPKLQDNVYSKADDLHLPDNARQKWLGLFRQLGEL